MLGYRPVARASDSEEAFTMLEAAYHPHATSCDTGSGSLASFRIVDEKAWIGLDGKKVLTQTVKRSHRLYREASLLVQ
jgi:hypothetical protein